MKKKYRVKKGITASLRLVSSYSLDFGEKVVSGFAKEVSKGLLDLIEMEKVLFSTE